MTKPTELSESTGQAEELTSDNGHSEQENLEKALAAGASNLREQIHIVIKCSQENESPQSVPPTIPEPVLTTRQARMTALARFADNFTETEIHSLLKEIVQITDPALRIPLVVRFALRLPPSAYRGMIREVWKQATTIENPAARTQILFELAPLLVLVNDEPGTPSPLLQVVGLAQSIKSTEARIRSLIALAPYLPHDFSQRVFRRVLSELTESQNDTLVSKSLTTLAPHLPGVLVDDVMAVTRTIVNPTERARSLIALARYMDSKSDQRLHEFALDAIDAIEDENERAEALMSFAPNLEHAEEGQEYPKLLEKALTSTIILTRRKLRAQVLVTLAPHLTSDLQGEALAAVHSLESERERAELLAKLAPNLPSDMLVASLAVAHTMRERDCRLQALTTLAQYVPESARHQTTMDALATASNLPNLYERVQALVDLVAILPENMIDQALRTALNAAAEIDNANARARALSLLGDKLPESLQDRALELALAIENPQQRLNALMGSVGSTAMSKRQRSKIYDELLACTHQMPLEYKRARALITIIPYLPAERLGEVEEIAQRMNDPIDQVNVYIAIAQNIPPEQRVPIIRKAAERIRRIDEGYDRASATAALVPYLSEEERAKLPKTVFNIIQMIADEYDKASAITLMASLLASEMAEPGEALPDGLGALRKGFEAIFEVQQPMLRAELMEEGALLWAGHAKTEETVALWSFLARKLVTLPMPDVLLCLGSLAPVFREIGGEDAIKDIAHLLGMR